MGKQLGVGIIGAGWAAGEHIRAFQANPNAEVRAIASRNEYRARGKAAAFHLRCDVYTDYEKMLERDDIDIVSVATPPDCHKVQAVAVAQAGKHLLLEKPMATTVEDARAICDAVATAGVKSVVGFMLRWNPLIRIIKTQLADRAIGEVFFSEIDYFHGIGPWYSQYEWQTKKKVGVSSLVSAGCHAVDTMRWLLRGEIVEVFQYGTHGNREDFAGYEFDPTSCTMCRFANGHIGKIACSMETSQPYVFNINLVGTHGTIRNNRIFSKTKFPGQTDWVEIPTVLPDKLDPSHHPFTPEIDHLVDCIVSGKESHACVADAYKTHEICFAADQSAQLGRPVALPLT